MWSRGAQQVNLGMLGMKCDYGHSVNASIKGANGCSWIFGCITDAQTDWEMPQAKPATRSVRHFDGRAKGCGMDVRLAESPICRTWGEMN